LTGGFAGFWGLKRAILAVETLVGDIDPFARCFFF